MCRATNSDRQDRLTRLENELRIAKRLIDALHHSEELYRTVLNASPDAIVVINSDQTVEFASPRAKELFGLAPNSPIAGRSIIDFAAPWDQERVRQRLGSTDPAGSDDEFALVRVDGAVFPASTRSAPWSQPGGAAHGKVLVIRDLTEQKRHEEVLRASEARFASVFAANPIGAILTRGPDAVIVDANPAFLQLCGYERDQVIGRTCADSGVWENAAQRDAVHRRILTLRRMQNVEVCLRHRSGSTVDTLGSFQVLELDGADHVMAMFVDVTERRRAEGLERQLLQSQRLEAVGTLASGIAHDVNNILSPMLIVPRLLEPALVNSHDRELLSIVEDNARRGADIVRQLLAFSRSGESHRASMTPISLLKQMGTLMRETFPREIAIEVEIPAAVPTIHADPTQLHQVVMNLCVNARDAMPGGGTLRVSVRVEEVRADIARAHPRAAPGPHVVISVVDTGAGIRPEIIDRIFDPFFTTKEIGRGTGLGLSTVLGIVTAHGGFVTVNSRIGEGTRFEVYLPAERQTREPVVAPETTCAPGRGERVFVVEDEEPVRLSLEQLLRALGYDVALARDGAEAIRFLQTDSASIDVLVTDLMMPKLGGVAVIREARQRQANLPVIAITGMADSGVLQAVNELGVREVLRKPFTADAVSAAIRRCFE